MPGRTSRGWLRRFRDDPDAPAGEAPPPDLGSLAHTWDVLGERDPLWAVLTKPGTRGGRWDPEEFFKDGEAQVDAALGLIEDDIGWALGTSRALDFGCGVGRLTQALCHRFDHVDGVDIAPSMIRGAERFNRFGDRCIYHLNARDDLALLPDRSFDLIYSTYVLQHMHPDFAERYVQEFVRLLSPGGLALFQMPTAKRSPRPNDPMPDAWFAADQRLADQLPAGVPAGEHAQARVRVVNTSRGVWPADGERAVKLGARWRQADLAIGAESRTELPSDLGPGDEAVLDMSLRAPDHPGRYTMECGLLQEGVAWFVDRGGPMIRTEIDVLAGSDEAPARTASEADEEDPPMEMHATPIETVTDWVEAAGGRIVRIIDAPPDEHYDGVLYAVALAVPEPGPVG
jgi:SAM-dependent methyltransferase